MIFILSFLFNGCLFSIGNSQGICEEDGCNYKETGVCVGVMEIYKNRHSLQNYLGED